MNGDRRGRTAVDAALRPPVPILCSPAPPPVPAPSDRTPDRLAVALPPNHGGRGPVTVRPATGATDRRRFIDFPFRLYEGHPYWVPPLRMDIAGKLNPKKNPFFQHGALVPFLAERGGEVVGRVAAIKNGQHLATHDDGAGFFGFIEAVDDAEVWRALFEAVHGWQRAEGLALSRGPVDPTMNDTAGLLVNGFRRPPAILMPYQPAYYAERLAELGYARQMTMWAFYVHDAYLDDSRLRRGAGIVRSRQPDVTVRPLDRARFDDDIRAALRIYNAAWAGNWGNVGYTEAEAQHLAAELKPVLEDELFLFVEKAGVPVAFSASLPNLNQVLKRLPDGRLLPFGLPKLLLLAKSGLVNEIRMALMGVLPEHRNGGLDALLVLETIDRGRALGFDACEMSWVLDVNKALTNALDKMGAVRDKEYVMLEKALG